MSLSPSTQSQVPSQRNGTKKKKRSEHDAELLPLLQGPSVEVVVGSGDKTASWTIPFALLAKHSNHLHVTLSSIVKEETPIVKKVTLADRSPSIFQIYVQWMYFDTIPGRYSLSRTSTGESLSNSFQLWTLGDYLQADEFKNRIMSELHSSYSLERYLDGFGFMELNSAEMEYCWSHTVQGSKLRTFTLDILSHHIMFGDYIRIEEDNEWQKLFIKHPDLQLQVLARIAASSNVFTSDVAKIPSADSYLEAIKEENESKENEHGTSQISNGVCQEQEEGSK